jgi:hypothetical protein
MRKRSSSSGACSVGCHRRGLWVNTCTAFPPTDSILSIAFEIPPLAETWAPKSTTGS